MIKNYKDISDVKILIYVRDLYIFLSLLLLSGCAHSSNETDDKQVAADYNVSFPELSITKNNDDSLIVKYQTTDGLKVIQLPKR